EEERLEAEGYYNEDEEIEDAEEADIRMKAELIREKRALIRNEAKMKKSLKNRAIIPRSAQPKKLSQMESHFESLGLNTTAIAARARSQSRGRLLDRGRSDNGDAMDLDTPESARDRLRSRSRAQSQINRREDGVRNVTARSKAERL